MKNLELILDKVGEADIKRKSIENQLLKKVKVQLVAYKGGFDGLVEGRELHLAKIRGILPKGFEVHHIIPLCCKNTQISLENMVIMDSASHRLLHRYIYDRALSLAREGQLVCVFIPDFNLDTVSTFKRFEPKFLQYLKERQRQ